MRPSAMLLSSIVAAAASSGCSDHCWSGERTLVGAEPVCTGAAGTASLTSPARYALPTTVPVADGRSCFNGVPDACGHAPVLHLAIPAGPGQNGLEVTLLLPEMQGSASYVFPEAWQVPYLNVGGELTSKDSAGISSSQHLEPVSGTINVESSTPTELRLSFDHLELSLRSTGETFSLTGGPAIVNNCFVKETWGCVDYDD